MIKKIVIGAGGGYDVVVAAMLRKRFQRECNELWDIGGLLNPKFIHFYFNGYVFEVEKAVNNVQKVYKFRRNAECSTFKEYSDYNSIHLVDAQIKQYVNCSVLNFSTLFEPREIALFITKEYHEVVFCDVGGDILFFGSQDSSVKTPIIDAFTLKIAHELYKLTGKKSKLAILGLGLDGELEKKNIERNLDILKSKNGIIEKTVLCESDISYLETLYNNVKAEGKGNTNQLLIDIWKGKYTSRSSLFEERNIMSFQKWFNQILLVDSEEVYINNPLCLCSTIEEMKNTARKLGVKLS